MKLILLLLLLCCLSANAQLADSLLTEKHIYAYTFSDPDKAKLILDLMRERNLGSEFSLDVAEGDLLYNNGKHHQALKYYKRALDSESQENTAQEYMQQLHRIISCYDGLHDEVKKTEYVKLLLDKSEEVGSKEMKSIALFEMGKMIYYQEDKLYGYQLIGEAIALMKASDYKNKYHNLRYNYNTLLMMLQRDGRYEEALVVLDDLESVVTASTHRTNNIEGLDEKEYKTLFAWRAVILSHLGRLKEADKAYEQWAVTGTNYRKDDYLITTYLLQRKQFDKIIEIYGVQEAFLKEQNDTINYHMRSLKRILGKAYEGKGDYQKAAEYYQSLAVLTDSLKVREQQSAAVELAKVYETNEKEIQLQEQSSELKVRTMLLFTAALAIFFLIILVWRRAKHTRTIQYKNRKMVSTIEELLQQKEEFHLLKDRLAKESTENTANSDMGNVPHDYSGLDDKALFEILDEIVVREQLYLQFSLSREDLMNLIHVNKNRLGQIMKQYAKTNTTVYINNKRLEYAVRLLNNSNQTIAIIAEQCGIPNVPTFNRLFKSKFGMTPVEFKKNIRNTSL